MFLEYAGIKPAATTDEIFDGSAEEVDFNMGNEVDDRKEGNTFDNSIEEDSDSNNMLKQALVTSVCTKKASKALGLTAKAN